MKNPWIINGTEIHYVDNRSTNVLYVLKSVVMGQLAKTLTEDTTAFVLTVGLAMIAQRTSMIVQELRV